eukprot:jgi/Bigna1/74465/fgenesh1_pg.29_\
MNSVHTLADDDDDIVITPFPTYFPSWSPTYGPSKTPSNSPSWIPTYGPSRTPSSSPSPVPTISPSASPSIPTLTPTNELTKTLSASPLPLITSAPTFRSSIPTQFPSTSPTRFLLGPLDMPPSLEILITESRISETRTLKIAALSTARRALRTPTDEDLQYNWFAYRISSDPEINDVEISAQTKTPLNLVSNISEPTISIAARSLGPGIFDFSVTVTDMNTELASTGSATVRVIGAPVISSLTVAPVNGVAFETIFNATVVASGSEPLLHQFATQELILSSFLSFSRLSIPLPEGNTVITVTTRDMVGGETSTESNLIVVAPPLESGVLIDPELDAEQELVAACEEIVRINLALLSLFNAISRNEIWDWERLDFAGTPNFLQANLDALNADNRFESELYAARVSLNTIERIPTSVRKLSECSLVNSTLTQPTGAPPIPQEVYQNILMNSFSEFSQLLWSIINLSFRRAITSDPGINGTRTEIILQDVETIIMSNHSNITDTDVGDYVQILNRTIAQTIPILFVDTELGNDTGGVLSNLVHVANGLTSVQLNGCDGLDYAIDLLDNFLALTGNNLVPRDSPFLIVNDILRASSRRVFADGIHFAATSEEVNVSISREISNIESRDTAVMAINSILLDLRNCRPPPDFATLTTNVASINVFISQNDSDSELEPGKYNISIRFNIDGNRYNENAVFSCQFWDPILSAFSDEGCITKLTPNGSIVCVCNHLTQFALLELDSESRSSSEEISYFFVGAAGVYGAIFFYLLFTMHKALGTKDKTVSDKAKLSFLLLQSLFSVPICLLLSNEIPKFRVRELDPGYLLFFFAVPHTLVWGTYTITLYQWKMINSCIQTNQLKINMFSKNYWTVCLVMSLVVATIWTSFAFYFYVRNSTTRLIGPLALAVVTFLFASGVIWVGKGTLRLLSMVRSRNNKRDLELLEWNRTVGIFIYILSLLLVLQSAMLVVFLVLKTTVEGTFVGLMAFYLADVIMIILQIDFLRGLRWLSFLSNISSSLLHSTTARSSKHTSAAASSGARKTAKTKEHNRIPLVHLNTGRNYEQKLVHGPNETNISFANKTCTVAVAQGNCTSNVSSDNNIENRDKRSMAAAGSPTLSIRYQHSTRLFNSSRSSTPFDKRPSTHFGHPVFVD